ncbi:DNA-binding transcriptional regulator SutR [Cognatishimia sp. WU-CL00825]
MSKDLINLNLRSIRAKSGLSLSATEKLTGVSKAMLGQIERGESSPTMATLWKLAKGFKLPLTAFIQEPGTTADSLTHHFDHSISVKCLLPYDPNICSETFLITLPAGLTHLSKAHAKGTVEDIFAVTSGIEFMCGGTWQSVAQNKAVRIAADAAHGYRNLSPVQAQLLNTIHYASPQPSKDDT